MKTKLPWRKAKEIEAILKEEFDLTPAQKAVLRLLKMGFTSHDLWLFNKTKSAQFLSDVWKSNTYNSFRDYEILGKFPREM